MPYLMSKGAGNRVAIYSRCEDILLAKAELLLLRDEVLKKYPDASIYAYVDTDPKFTIGRFKRAYRGDHQRYKVLMSKRDEILKGNWDYPEVESPKKAKEPPND